VGVYESYWGLQERPFQNAPDPRFLFYSPAHEEALVRLLYAVSENKGLALFTGEVGTGKTLLARVFRRELAARGYHTANVLSPDLTPDDLLRTILRELGAAAGPDLERDHSAGRLWEQLSRFLLGNGASRETVVVIDEAQTISDARTLETVRMLLNLVRGERFLATVVLVGHPELRTRVAQSPALRQRVAVACELRPLTRDETAEYVAHRLRTAGASGELFAEPAIDALYQLTGGIPRAVNTLADLSMLAGSSAQAERIDAACVQQASHEVLGPVADGTPAAGGAR
jgi:general secretion pathway protein A